MEIAYNVVAVPTRGFQREWLYETMIERKRPRAICDSTIGLKGIRSWCDLCLNIERRSRGDQLVNRRKGNKISWRSYDSTSKEDLVAIDSSTEEKGIRSRGDLMTQHRKKISWRSSTLRKGIRSRGDLMTQHRKKISCDFPHFGKE